MYSRAQLPGWRGMRGVEPRGLEPLTPCMQSTCVTSVEIALTCENVGQWWTFFPLKCHSSPHRYPIGLPLRLAAGG